MSGTPEPQSQPEHGPVTPPPEVPEEFADAYRAAYERALAEQTGGPYHVAEPAEVPEEDETWRDRLPVRQGRLLVGTHREERDAVYLRDRRWFVPLVLVVLVVVLVVGAYLLGRTFAAQLSSSNVIGPSPTSETSICAPKIPVSTCVPASRSAATTAS